MRGPALPLNGFDGKKGRLAPAPERLKRHRTLFVSDVHLGTRACKADALLDFLTHNDCDTLYLVGDIVDGWRLQQSWYWDETHSAVVNAILAKAKEGTRVVYIPGNHDEVFRDYAGLLLAGVELQHEVMHRTADGRTLLVLHGDRFDGIIGHGKLLERLGDRAYGAALAANERLNRLRVRLGLPYWSLATYLKSNVSKAAAFIEQFEEAAAREARLRGADGVVCGHIHHAAMRTIGGIAYCNDGDWVESCTALAEDRRGRLQIVQWREAKRAVAAPSYDYLPERVLSAA